MAIDEGPTPVLVAQERHQREDSALAIVVGAHDHRDIFNGRDDHQRPNDKRQYAQGLLGRDGAAGPIDRRLDRVEWAGADVAVNDAQGPERQRPGSITAAPVFLHDCRHFRLCSV